MKIMKPLLWLAIYLFPALTNCLSAQNENSLSYINDSTIARYRYEKQEYSYAQIPSGTSIDKIDIMELDLLKAIETKTQVVEGINSSYEPFLEIKNLETNELEDWMSTPFLQILTPNASYGIDSLGNELYQFKNNDSENQAISEVTLQNTNNGYSPLMPFFPNLRDDFVVEAQNSGAVLTILPENGFKLTYQHSELIIEPNLKLISKSYIMDSTFIKIKTAFELFAPYGYVPVWETEEKTRLDLPNPVTLIYDRIFYDHAIKDISGVIEKYTDKSYIETYPNPIENQYEVILRGITDGQVSQVQIRDHMGNIIQTHISPNVNEDIVLLDASYYPAGILIILVSTNQGTYSKTITKI